MNNHISANDLKTKGISAVESMFSENAAEVVITVHGKPKFVVLPIETYDYYRKCELSMAYEETKKAYEKGRFTTESVEDHIAALRSSCSK